MRPGAKKIKRRKPGSGPSKNYFDTDTHEAIILYNKTDDIAEKNKIYTEKISPAFQTLVDNLINVYGFHVQHDSKADLRHECVEFLHRVLPKFKADKGSKAFSYFNVVAKHALTITAKKSAKSVQIFSSLDDKESFSAHDMEIIENYNVLAAPDEIPGSDESKKQFKAIMDIISSKVKTEQESECVSAINLLFDKVEDLEFTNKRGVMVYIRELTGLAPKQLSIVLGAIKKYYKAAKEEVIKNGE